MGMCTSKKGEAGVVFVYAATGCQENIESHVIKVRRGSNTMTLL